MATKSGSDCALCLIVVVTVTPVLLLIDPSHINPTAGHCWETGNIVDLYGVGDHTHAIALPLKKSTM